MSLNVKLKIKNGTSNSTITLLDSSTIKDLLEEINKLNHNVNDIEILIGFPPKPLIFSNLSSTLSEVNIRNGDSLILKETINNNIIKTPQVTYDVDNLLQQQTQVDTRMLMKITIPSDNSCLFTSIRCCLNNGMFFDYDSTNDRQSIVSMVLNDPIKYNSALLDNKTPQEYSDWILNKDHWGGAIEISLLCQMFNIEIDVVNVQYVRIDKFGEDSDFQERILILYDGIHYDALGMEDFTTGIISYKFPASDETILTKALALATETKASHQFTDMNKFTIKCQQCDSSFVGQEEAVKHASSTGHNNFGEVNKS